MKLQLLLIFLALSLFCSVPGITQTSTATYNTKYETSGQNLWKSGSNTNFQINKNLFGFNYNKSGKYGGIESIAGQKFGAEVSAGTWGDIGSGLSINFGQEQIDIDYNAEMQIDYPSVESFQAGSEIVFATDWSPVSSGSGIHPDEYNINFALQMKMGLGFDMSAKLCAFSCSNYDIFDIDIPTKTYDLVEVSRKKGVSLLNDMYNFPPGNGYPTSFFPFYYSDPTGTINLTLNMPSNSSGSSYFKGKELHYRNTSHYFDMYFSMGSFIGALHIPGVSTFFNVTSNSWRTGPFYLSYTLLDAGYSLGLHNKQHLKFKPEMHGKLDFPANLNYRVVNPSNGATVESGFDSTIHYMPGQEVRVEFPCHYSHMDVVPSFSMKNNFSNHTYDSISFDFIFKALEFSVGIESMTVIERKCVTVGYPCGSFYNPKWCKKKVCTPAVKFDGYENSYGPLFKVQPNLYNTSYNWVRNNWEMDGFNKFEHLAPIHIKPAEFSIATTSTDVLCHGKKTGQATASITNGKPPYSYQWSNGKSSFTHQKSQTVKGLAAGVHYVSVIDDNGCMVFNSVEINQPDEPLSAQAQITDLSCHNQPDGIINIKTRGGTSPYSWAWSNGQSTDSVYGLAAGDHTLTITDANGCELIESYEINQPEKLHLSFEVNDVNCKGDSSGNAKAVVSGGTAPYTYQWSEGTNNRKIENLPSGDYQLTVTDKNGCQIIDSIEIKEPLNPLTASKTVTNLQCYQDQSGIIEVQVTGGTSPYQYKWYNKNESRWLNQSSSKLEGIKAGNYQVIITDAAGCDEKIEASITEPAPLAIDTTITHVLCHGENTGSIETNVTGGTQPYSLNWSNGDTTQITSALSANDYALTITDDNGCTSQLKTSVKEPSKPLRTSIATTAVECYGEASGTITANSSGGTSPYTYNWSDGASTAKRAQLPADVYTLTVSDDNGCKNYSGKEITQPEAPLTISAQTEDASCFRSADGKIQLDISGGTLPYQIYWDNGEIIINNKQHHFDNVPAGYYNITLRDHYGCEAYTQLNIEQPKGMDINMETGIVSCYGGHDGYANTSVSGGTPPYRFKWSNGSTRQNLDSVPAGYYSLTVTDNQDCGQDTNLVIESYPDIEAGYSYEAPTCRDIDDAVVSLNASGGTGSYTYQWSNGKNSRNINELASGDYSVTITDTNSCIEILDVRIPESYNECLNIPNSFTPNNDGYNDTWVLRNIEAYPNAMVHVFTSNSRTLFKSKGSYTPWDGTFRGKDVPSGTYYYVITLNKENGPYSGSVTILR